MSKFTRKLYQLAENNIHKDILKHYASAIEQVAANEYGHVTEEGWCCACAADVAFMMQEAERLASEPPTLAKASPVAPQEDKETVL